MGFQNLWQTSGSSNFIWRPHKPIKSERSMLAFFLMSYELSLCHYVLFGKFLDWFAEISFTFAVLFCFFSLFSWVLFLLKFGVLRNCFNDFSITIDQIIRLIFEQEIYNVYYWTARRQFDSFFFQINYLSIPYFSIYFYIRNFEKNIFVISKYIFLSIKEKTIYAKNLHT